MIFMGSRTYEIDVVKDQREAGEYFFRKRVVFKKAASLGGNTYCFSFRLLHDLATVIHVKRRFAAGRTLSRHRRRVQKE
jgi:hypothetical protein